MNIKPLFLASLSGCIVLFLLGYLFYGIIFHQDFDNEIITARNVFIVPPKFHFLILGNLVGSMFLTYLHFRIQSIHDASSSFVLGFLVFCMMGLYTNLISYGRTDILTFHGIFLDSIILAIMGGVASIFIFFILKWMKN